MTAAEYFRQEGMEKGIEKRTLEIAVNALKQGFAVKAVVDLTELDTFQIEQLKKEKEIESADK